MYKPQESQRRNLRLSCFLIGRPYPKMLLLPPWYMNPCAWKIIPKGKITLDFSNCKNADDIHKQIKIRFGFPDYHGENWDALWDCLRDFALSEKKTREVQIIGREQLSEDLNKHLEETINSFKELEEKYPNIHFIIEK